MVTIRLEWSLGLVSVRLELSPCFLVLTLLDYGFVPDTVLSPSRLVTFRGELSLGSAWTILVDRQ